MAIDISALHEDYARGGSPLAAVAAAYARLEAVGDPGIFIHLVAQADAEAAAAALPAFDPKAYPLWGVPFAVKDNIDIAGLPTTAACPDFTYTANETAPAVQRLLDAGAILIGKTNLDQFATGLVGLRSPYPAPVNPFDPARVPGGSSSGSAVAVSQGIVVFSLGTDTAGSGRVPAGLNNLVGLKPSLGALSTRGVVPACRTLDCVSIFAGSVGDARRVFEIAAAYDAADPYARVFTPSGGTIRVVGVPDAPSRHFFGDAHAEAAFDAALARLRGLGIETQPLDFTPFLAVARLLYEGAWVGERRAALGAFMDERPGSILDVTRAIIGKADGLSARDAFEGIYVLAALKRETEALWSGIDALAVPTTPITPTVADLAADPVGPNSRLGTYTNFVNLLDLSALAVPGPFRADGFPAGLTFIAPRGHDLALADLGQRYFPGVGGLAGLRMEAA